MPGESKSDQQAHSHIAHCPIKKPSQLKHNSEVPCCRWASPSCETMAKRARSSSLNGQHVLQVVPILDVTKPSNSLGSSSHRCAAAGRPRGPVAGAPILLHYLHLCGPSW